MEICLTAHGKTRVINVPTSITLARLKIIVAKQMGPRAVTCLFTLNGAPAPVQRSLQLVGVAPSDGERSHATVLVLAAWLLAQKIAESDINAEEVEMLSDALMDLGSPYDDMEWPAFQRRYGSRPRVMAELILRHYERNEKDTAKVLGLTYLEKQRGRVAMREQLAQTDRRANEVRALRAAAAKLDIPARLVEHITQSASVPFSARVGKDMEYFSIRLPKRYFEKTTNYRRMLVRVESPTTHVTVYARPMGDTARFEGDDVVVVSPAVDAAIGMGTRDVLLRFYEQMAEPTEVEFRLYASADTPVPEGLDAILEQLLHNRPALTLGEELRPDASDATIVVRVQSLKIADGSQVGAAAMPLDGQVPYRITYDENVAAVLQPIGCAACGTAATALRPCGNQCGTLYCGRACQSVDWEAKHKHKCGV